MGAKPLFVLILSGWLLGAALWPQGAQALGDNTTAGASDAGEPPFQELTFTNGKVVFGRILSSNEDKFRLQTPQGTFSLPWHTVRQAKVLPASEAHHRWARAALERGARGEAMNHAREALALDRDLALEGDLSRLLEEDEATHQAKADGQRASFLDQARRYRDRMKPEQALALIEEGLTEYPDDPELLGEALQTHYALHKSSLKPVSEFESPYWEDLERVDPGSPTLRGIAGEVAIVCRRAAGDDFKRPLIQTIIANEQNKPVLLVRRSSAYDSFPNYRGRSSRSRGGGFDRSFRDRGFAFETLSIGSSGCGGSSFVTRGGE